MASSRPGAALAKAVASRDASSIRQLMSQWGGALNQGSGGDEKDVNGFMDDFMQAGGVKLLLKELDESCTPAAAAPKASSSKSKVKTAKGDDKLSQQVAALEEKKKAAIRNEDFALAGRLKAQLEELRGPSRTNSPRSKPGSPTAAAAGGADGEDPLANPSAELVESLRDDERLARLFDAARSSGAEAGLEAECRSLLAAAVGTSPVPLTLNLRRDVIQFHADELVDAVADEVALAAGPGGGGGSSSSKSPGTNGSQSGAIASALKTLRETPLAQQDPRVVRFFTRAKAIAVASTKGKGAAAAISEAEVKSALKALNGFWLDSSGGANSIQDGKAVIGGQTKVSVIVKANELLMDGMSSVSFTSKRIDWKKDGEVISSWSRLTKEEHSELLRELAARKAASERQAKEEASERKRQEEEAKKAQREAEQRAKEDAAAQKRREQEEAKAKKLLEQEEKKTIADHEKRRQLEEQQRKEAEEARAKQDAEAKAQEEMARAGDPATTAVGIVLAALMRQARLKTLASSGNVEQVESNIRTLLKSAFDGKQWPAPFLLREESLSPETLTGVAQAVEERLRGQVSLGEDVLAVAISSFCHKKIPQEQDPRITRLIRELEQRALEAPTPTLWALTGVWKTSAGLFCTVFDGKCTFVKGQSFSIETQKGSLALNGWIATEVAEEGKVVKWTKGKQQMHWDRLQQVDDVEALQGMWKNSDGLICLVASSRCTFTSKEWDLGLAIERGLVVMNGWSAIAVTDEVLRWRKGAQVSEWKRIHRASEVEVMHGQWLNTDGLVCDVADGKCTFKGKKTAYPMNIENGFIVLNSWKAVRLAQDSITWEKDGRKMEWQRNGTAAAEKENSAAPKGSNAEGASATVPLPKGSEQAMVDEHAAKVVSREVATAKFNDAPPPPNLPGGAWALPLTSSPEDVISEPDSEPCSREEDSGKRGKDSLSRAAGSLLDALHADARFSSVTRGAQVEDLERHLKELLLRSLGDSEWPSSYPKRSLLKACFADVADLLAVVLKTPRKVSLDDTDDALTHLFSALKEDRFARDVRWMRFQARMQELAQRTQMATKTKAQRVESFNGLWKNTDGLACAVTDGDCNFFTKGSVKLVQLGGKFSLNGWEASAISDSSVQWHKGEKAMHWNRITQASELNVLDGVWTNSEGATYSVSSGSCSFGNAASSFPIIVQDNSILLNGWTATSIDSANILWKKAGKTMEWQREGSGGAAAGKSGKGSKSQAKSKSSSTASASPRPPSPAKAPAEGAAPTTEVAMQTLEGVWRSTSEEGAYTVMGGKCTAPSGEAFDLAVEGEAVSFDRWVAPRSQVSSAEVKWSKDKSVMVWHRFESAAGIEVLDGKWQNTEGLICTVSGGVCTFLAKSQRVELKLADGVLSLNGWIAQALTKEHVTWQKGGKHLEWHRLAEGRAEAANTSAQTGVSESPRARGSEPSPRAPGAAAPPTSSPTIEQFNGVWLGPDATVAIVADGVSTSRGGLGGEITIAAGVAAIDGWKALSVSDASIRWERAGEATEWTRAATVEDIARLNGFWRNSEGLVCFCSRGECAFVSKGKTCKLALQNHMLMLNEWIATSVSETGVSWRRGAQVLEWSPIEEPRMLESIHGVWTSNETGTISIADGVCTFAGNKSASLAIKDSCLVMNGWVASSITPTSIRWQKGSKRLEWVRGESQEAPSDAKKQVAAPAAADEGRGSSPARGGLAKAEEGKPSVASPREESSPPLAPRGPRQDQGEEGGGPGRAEEATVRADALTGVWVNAEGLLCTVANGVCTFIAAGAHDVESSNGSVVLNKWRVAVVKEQEITWERDGKRTQWFRLQHPAEVEDINGRWRNADGLLCEVSRGICVFSGHPPISLEMREGLICLNGWKTTAILDKQIVWQRSGKTMLWDRVSYPTS